MMLSNALNTSMPKATLEEILANADADTVEPLKLRVAEDGHAEGDSLALKTRLRQIEASQKLEDQLHQDYLDACKAAEAANKAPPSAAHLDKYAAATQKLRASLNESFRKEHSKLELKHQTKRLTEIAKSAIKKREDACKLQQKQAREQKLAEARAAARERAAAKDALKAGDAETVEAASKEATRQLFEAARKLANAMPGTDDDNRDERTEHIYMELANGTLSVSDALAKTKPDEPEIAVEKPTPSLTNL